MRAVVTLSPGVAPSTKTAGLEARRRPTVRRPSRSLIFWVAT
ncbi:hypothetical protein [Aminiphilus sp.]|nr:hypothetical protein [Aminiphilus sp.]